MPALPWSTFLASASGLSWLTFGQALESVLSPDDETTFTHWEQAWIDALWPNGIQATAGGDNAAEWQQWLMEPIGVRLAILAVYGMPPGLTSLKLPLNFKPPGAILQGANGASNHAEAMIQSLFLNVTRWPGIVARSAIFARDGQALTGEMAAGELAQFSQIETAWLGATFNGNYADWQKTGDINNPGWMNMTPGIRLLFYVEASNDSKHGDQNARTDLKIWTWANALPYVLSYYINPDYSSPSTAASKFYAYADQMVSLYQQIQARLAAKVPNGSQASTGAGTQAGGGTGASGAAPIGFGSSQGIPVKQTTANASSSSGSGILIGLLALLALLGSKK